LTDTILFYVVIASTGVAGTTKDGMGFAKCD